MWNRRFGVQSELPTYHEVASSFCRDNDCKVISQAPSEHLWSWRVSFLDDFERNNYLKNDDESKESKSKQFFQRFHLPVLGPVWQVGQPSEEYLQHVRQQLLQEKQVPTWEQRQWMKAKIVKALQRSTSNTCNIFWISSKNEHICSEMLSAPKFFFVC